MQVAIYLRNFVRKVVNQSDNILNEGILKQFIDTFFTCCVSEVIDLPAKQHIILILESLLMIY